MPLGIAGHPLSPADYQQLIDQSLADPGRCQAFEITTATVAATVQERLRLLRQGYAACQALYPTDPLLPLWTTWLPLVQQVIRARQSQANPLILGILGLQGTGKTTLTRLLKALLDQVGYPTLCLSLDDLYLPYAERLALCSRDPRLIWRGPPGTHDLELGLRTLTQLQTPGNQPIPIPRFDKAAWGGAGDRLPPDRIDPVEIILFEGWFVGLRPIDPQQFASAPPPILTPEDRAFARDNNQRLADYLPLWERLDRLLVLQPVDYQLSYQWRQQAERQLRQTQQSGMSDAEIEQFVNYFWKALHPNLFLPALLNQPSQVDWVIEIEADHSPGQVTGRANCLKD